MNRFDNQTWEELQRPAREGGMSMGEGRKKLPEIVNGKVVNGTVFEGCPNTPDGFHRFTCVANLNSVEHFVCDHCDYDWWD